MKPIFLGILAIGAFGCASAPPLPAREPVRADPPRLVLLVVYDQMGSSTLERQLPRLDENGAIRRTMARGHAVSRVRYAYAATFTAPGHAAIVSGAPPFVSGIAANNVWDAERGRIPVMDDGEHATLGREDAFASPARMRAISVPDVLHHETGGRAIIASIAMKDRSAILPGGRHADVCLWFDRRAGGFTTSTYYASELPPWLVAWQSEHGWETYLTPAWEPMDRARLEQDLGADDRSGEGAYGFDATFPHQAEAAGEVDAFLSLPRSAEMQLEVAERMVEELHMGEDSVPDFLAISISATDYVGHTFGPDSWEYADALARIDARVGALIERLEARTELAVLITSDHGAAPLVERSVEAEHAGVTRYASESELEALQAHLRERLGEGQHVDGWLQPYVYVADADRARVVRETIRWVSRRPGVLGAFDARHGDRLRADSDPLRRAIGLSLPSEWPGDVIVLPRERSAAVEDLPADRGTSHGSPWAYDVEVPAIYSGPNVVHGVSEDVLRQARVATTIAHLIGVAPPPGADTSVLPGVTPLRADRGMHDAR